MSDWSSGVCSSDRRDVDGAGAGLFERLGGLARPEAVDGQPVLPDAHRDRHEIAVRRHDSETIDTARVEQIHRVDRHFHVGRVLAFGEIEMLMRLVTVPERYIGPGLARLLAPVSLDPPHVARSEF